MRSVGIKVLKNKLSEYIRLVAAGETVLITDRDRVVAELPLKQRLAFTLRKIHDLDYEAIGESLECSPESARAHVFQALKKIRVCLNGHELPALEPMR